MNTATTIQRRNPTLLAAFAPLLLALSAGDVSAAEETLECRLYMGRSTEITGVASEWNTTEVADIVLNVTLPD